MDTSPVTALPEHPVRLSDLSNRRETAVILSPDATAREAVAVSLGIAAVRKLRFDAVLKPIGKRDWLLKATLGATVVQECVVTLDPVTTRIDEIVERRYLAEMTEPDGSEIEMPEDDTAESLPVVLDLAQVMVEALSLALPPYPRSPGADMAEYVVTEPGQTPLTADKMKPFAGLAALRDSLTKPDDSAE